MEWSVRMQTGDEDLLYLLNSESPHCTAGQNHPKLASHARECHCRYSLHGDVSSHGSMREQSDFCLAPQTPKSGPFEGEVPACSYRAYTVPGTFRTPKELYRVELLLLARHDAFSSPPQFFICKMGTMIVRPLRDCPKVYI